MLVLKQLVEECSWFLPELQAGFRKSRDAQEMIFMVQAYTQPHNHEFGAMTGTYHTPLMHWAKHTSPGPEWRSHSSTSRPRT